ncbi:MAG TPA: phage tail protein [Allosphingosinicella sp.]|nr:phage tail protein [Allosphingosinicella sp.]
MGKTVVAVAGLALGAVAMAIAPGIGTAIFGKVFMATFLGSIATAVIAGAITAVGMFGLRALGIGALAAPSTKGQTSPIVVSQSLTDSYLLYGKRRVIYLKWVFFHSKVVGGVHTRWFVFAVAGHPCQGNPEWIVNDEPVTVDGAGKVTSGVYADHLWLWFDRGEDDATANATFVAECDGKWTTDHRGRGVAKIYMKAEMTEAVVQAGFATPSPVIEGKDDIYDPRTGTYGYSRNAILVTYDWLKLAREEGGFGAWPEEIPDDDFIAANANVCDEVVNGAPRYALDAAIVTGAAPSELRAAMVLNMAGHHCYQNGKVIVRPGYFVPPTGESLSEADLAGPIQVSPFLPGDVAANQVQGSFIDPANNYQPMPFTTMETPGAVDIAQMDLDLAFTTNKDQADRVASIMLKRAQAEKTLLWPMNLAGLAYQALDTVQVATERYGLSNYAWTVTRWSLAVGAESVDVVMNLREENPEIYDPPAVAAASAPPTIAQASPVNPATDAGSVSIAPPGSMTATDVQSAVEELETGKAPKANPTFTGLVSTAGQIKFPPVQAASADPNTLDDYEEGPFTPILLFGGNAVGMTYNSTNGQLGRYTKIGRMVYIDVRIVLTAKGSSTGIATITGLPFTAAAHPTASGAVRASAMVSVAMPIYNIGPSNATIALMDFTGGSEVSLTDADFSNNSYLLISAAYAV